MICLTQLCGSQICRKYLECRNPRFGRQWRLWTILNPREETKGRVSSCLMFSIDVVFMFLLVQKFDPPGTQRKCHECRWYLTAKPLVGLERSFSISKRPRTCYMWTKRTFPSFVLVDVAVPSYFFSCLYRRGRGFCVHKPPRTPAPFPSQK